jgi:hypothetical protein
MSITPDVAGGNRCSGDRQRTEFEHRYRAFSPSVIVSGDASRRNGMPQKQTKDENYTLPPSRSMLRCDDVIINENVGFQQYA